jgi:type IV pilus assembly protein PilA
VEKENGFSLVELLVVMVIIGILAAVAVPAYLSQRSKGYEAQAVNDMGNVRTMVETYAVDNDGSYAGLNGSTQTSPALVGLGLKTTQWVSISIVSTTDTYCIEAEHAQLATEKLVLHSSDEGVVQRESMSGAGC